MRFGIGSMQVGRLLEQAGSPEALLHYLMTFDHAAAVRDLAEHGFPLIELSADVELFLPNAYTEVAVQGLAGLKQELDLAYTVHLPMWSVEPATPLSEVRQGSAAAVVRAIQTTAPLEPEVYVLHATNALAAEMGRWNIPPVAKNALLRILQDNAVRSLEDILNATGVDPHKLAIETVEFPFDYTLELADELDLGICVDVGHVLAGFSGPTDVFDVLEESRTRLAEIHLHDTPRMGPDGRMRYDEDHRALGEGDLDLPRLLTWLDNLDFDIPVIMELALPQAMESLERIRSVGVAV